MLGLQTRKILEELFEQKPAQLGPNGLRAKGLGVGDKSGPEVILDLLEKVNDLEQRVVRLEKPL